MEADPMPFLTPAAWGERYLGATGFQVGPREEIDGELTQVVTFWQPPRTSPSSAPVWYAWWVGLASSQVRQEALISTRQYVVTRFSGFDAALEINPPTATSLAFPPAADTETLILIATFHHNEGVVDTGVHNEIRRAITDAVADLDQADDIRVEVEPARITADARTEAEMLGNTYKASIVIWGEDTGIRITVNYLDLRESDPDANEVSISETQRTQLADPPAYARFVTEDLPAQLAFLSLYTIGQSYDVKDDYQAAV